MEETQESEQSFFQPEVGSLWVQGLISKKANYVVWSLRGNYSCSCPVEEHSSLESPTFCPLSPHTPFFFFNLLVIQCDRKPNNLLVRIVSKMAQALCRDQREHKDTALWHIFWWFKTILCVLFSSVLNLMATIVSYPLT